MVNAENIPIFVDSVLKVTATEEIDLSSPTPDNSSIEDLLEKQDAEEKTKQ